MKLLRLPRFKVKLGAPLPWNVRDDQERLLLTRGFVLTTQQQLESLLERGAYVDLEEARAVERAHAPDPAPHGAHALNLFGAWDELSNSLYKLLDRARRERIFAQLITEFGDLLVTLIDRDVDIAIYHAVRQESAQLFFYGYSHAIHTATLGYLLARRLDWPAPRLRSLLNAALTMNMSVLALQGQMAKQDTPVTSSQREQVRQHPQATADLLVKLGVVDLDWLTAVQQHHERADGSGYPKGIKDVSEMAIALRVIDVFMAKISPRVARPALSIHDAELHLFREDNGGELSGSIIKEIGIYPPGDVVKLANGELGVVIRRTTNLKCPIVSAVTDKTGQRSIHTVQRDTSKAEFAIVCSSDNQAIVARMPPERVYGYARI